MKIQLTKWNYDNSINFLKRKTKTFFLEYENGNNEILIFLLKTKLNLELTAIFKANETKL